MIIIIKALAIITLYLTISTVSISLLSNNKYSMFYGESDTAELGAAIILGAISIPTDFIFYLAPNYLGAAVIGINEWFNNE